jgi:VanZ family protein
VASSDPAAPRALRPLEMRGVLRLLRMLGALLQRLPRSGGWILAALWMGFITWLSSLSSDALPSAPWAAYPSNLAHAALFGLLALWTSLGLPRAGGWPRLDARGVALVLALVLACAVADEWHQASTPGRSPSVYDLGTDLAGAGATLAVAGYAGRRSAVELGLWLRLALGAAACALAALAATLAPNAP